MYKMYIGCTLIGLQKKNSIYPFRQTNKKTKKERHLSKTVSGFGFMLFFPPGLLT